MLFLTALLIAGLAASPGWAYFLLKLPKGLGYDMQANANPPCGGFGFDGRILGANFSIHGDAFAAISTVANITYTIKLRFLDHAKNETVDFLPPLLVSNYGSVCIPNITIKKEWLGEVAEFQVIQDHASGRTYQCSMVQFVDLPVNVDGLVDCKNSTGVTATFQPWGSNVTTTPQPSGAQATSHPSDDASEEDSSGAISRCNPWMVASVTALIAFFAHLV